MRIYYEMDSPISIQVLVKMLDVIYRFKSLTIYSLQAKGEGKKKKKKLGSIKHVTTKLQRLKNIFIYGNKEMIGAALITTELHCTEFTSISWALSFFRSKLYIGPSIW